ncbi:leucine-rich repeat-containing protein 56 [Aethina tumida]|uniref:leucine-rich repeat-containing protein 56 n=1 Tax=Aethina tumida TaxID=116153 RepID=UPI00214994E8|nr:leucine-rich repeat-containing protein 56 [Aethina tumida]
MHNLFNSSNPSRCLKSIRSYHSNRHSEINNDIIKEIMPPNLEEDFIGQELMNNNEHAQNIQLVLTPLSLDSDSDHGADENEENIDVVGNSSRVPLEQNLRELLVELSYTEDLESITQLKLKVIARELPLQQLGILTPNLRELILDGSYVSSLRDLGCGLKNLKILRVNNCGVNTIDSVFGFEMLEELYAADNLLQDLLPCAFLSNLRVLDVRRNYITISNTLSFLNTCSKLESIFIAGNNNVESSSTYRESIKRTLPGIKSLDGIPYNDDENLLIDVEDEFSNLVIEEVAQGIGSTRPNNSFRNRRNRHISTGFVVDFPPRVFLERALSLNDDDVLMRDETISSEDMKLENVENEG